MNSEHLSSRLKSRFSSTRRPSTEHNDTRVSHQRNTSTASSNSLKSLQSARSNASVGSSHLALYSATSSETRHSHSRSSSSTSNASRTSSATSSTSKSSVGSHQKSFLLKKPHLPSIPSNSNLKAEQPQLSRKPTRLFGSRSAKDVKQLTKQSSTVFSTLTTPCSSSRSSPVVSKSSKFQSGYFHEDLLRNECLCEGCKHNKNGLSHKLSKARLSHSHPYKHNHDTTSMDSLDTFANNILDIVSYNKREVKWNF